MRTTAQWLTAQSISGKEFDLYEVEGDFDVYNFKTIDEKAAEAHFQSVLRREEIVGLKGKFPPEARFFLQDASDSASGNRIQYLLRIHVPKPNELPEIVEFG